MLVDSQFSEDRFLPYTSFPVPMAHNVSLRSLRENGYRLVYDQIHMGAYDIRVPSLILTAMYIAAFWPLPALQWTREKLDYENVFVLRRLPSRNPLHVEYPAVFKL